MSDQGSGGPPLLTPSSSANRRRSEVSPSTMMGGVPADVSLVTRTESRHLLNQAPRSPINYRNPSTESEDSEYIHQSDLDDIAERDATTEHDDASERDSTPKPNDASEFDDDIGEPDGGDLEPDNSTPQLGDNSSGSDPFEELGLFRQPSQVPTSPLTTASPSSRESTRFQPDVGPSYTPFSDDEPSGFQRYARGVTAALEECDRARLTDPGAYQSSLDRVNEAFQSFQSYTKGASTSQTPNELRIPEGYQLVPLGYQLVREGFQVTAVGNTPMGNGQAGPSNLNRAQTQPFGSQDEPQDDDNDEMDVDMPSHNTTPCVRCLRRLGKNLAKGYLCMPAEAVDCRQCEFCRKAKSACVKILNNDPEMQKMARKLSNLSKAIGDGEKDLTPDHQRFAKVALDKLGTAGYPSK
ncbi:hypothetical protein ACHAPJ_012455 [Fusarium lateritium]